MEPKATFSLRGFVAGSVAILGLAAALLSSRRRNSERRAWSTAPLYCLLAVGIITASTVALQWHHFQRQFQQSMETHSGTVSISDLNVSPDLLSRFDWVWSNSALGIDLSSRQGIVGVRNLAKGARDFSTLIILIDRYAATPSLANLPPRLRDYQW